jgi:hypothetical protein
MAGNASGVRVIDLDIPFLNLTWFFVKASLALAFAVALTSWVWVLIGTGMATLSALLVVGLGVPSWFDGAPEPVAAPTAAPAPAPPAIVVVPAPAPAPVPVPPPAPEAAAASEPNPDANRAATEAAQRAELERIRRERAREQR